METPRTKQWPQYLAAITATISFAITGTHIGWTSPSLLYLKGPDSHLSLTSDESSWVASVCLLGNIPGNILAGFIVDRYGRKRTLLAAAVPQFISWILILLAPNAYVLYVARFISGIGQGVIYVVCPMYLGEIADTNIRGALGCFIKMMFTFGELYAHAIGPFVPYDVLVYLCVIIPVIFMLSFIWMPESPYFYLMHGRKSDAENSLMQLRLYTSRDHLAEDLDEMNDIVLNDLSNRGDAWQLFKKSGNRKAIIVNFGLQLILQFSGLAPIESYTQEMFEVSDSAIPASIAVILLGIFQLASGVAAAILVDKMGRRPLLLSTSLLAGIALTISAVFYYLKLGLEMNVDGKGWVLDASIIMYEIAVALGLNPLSYMMLGELFPTNVKGIGVTLVTIWGALLAAISTKMYQVIADAFGMYVSFGWFACSCFLGVIFIAFIVPETKGKSFVQIQDELNGRKAHLKQKKIDVSVVHGA